MANRAEATEAAEELDVLASFMILSTDMEVKAKLVRAARLLRLQLQELMQVKKEAMDAKSKHRRKRKFHHNGQIR